MYKIILITPLLLTLSACAAPMATENYVNRKVAAVETIATNAAAVACHRPPTSGHQRIFAAGRSSRSRNSRRDRPPRLGPYGPGSDYSGDFGFNPHWNNWYRKNNIAEIGGGSCVAMLVLFS